LLRGRFGDQAVPHLPLHHQDRTGEDRTVRNELPNDRSGCLVGKVSGDNEFRPTSSRMCLEIEIRRIALTDFQSILVPEFLMQHAHHVTVELDRENLGAALEKGVGQRSEAWTDLDELLAHGHRRVRDLGYGARLNQEVLRK
jgi:hypothetical protein